MHSFHSQHSDDHHDYHHNNKLHFNDEGVNLEKSVKSLENDDSDIDDEVGRVMEHIQGADEKKPKDDNPRDNSLVDTYPDYAGNHNVENHHTPGEMHHDEIHHDEGPHHDEGAYKEFSEGDKGGEEEFGPDRPPDKAFGETPDKGFGETEGHHIDGSKPVVSVNGEMNFHSSDHEPHDTHNPISETTEDNVVKSGGFVGVGLINQNKGKFVGGDYETALEKPRAPTTISGFTTDDNHLVQNNELAPKVHNHETGEVHHDHFHQNEAHVHASESPAGEHGKEISDDSIIGDENPIKATNENEINHSEDLATGGNTDDGGMNPDEGGGYNGGPEGTAMDGEDPDTSMTSDEQADEISNYEGPEAPYREEDAEARSLQPQSVNLQDGTEDW